MLTQTRIALAASTIFMLALAPAAYAKTVHFSGPLVTENNATTIPSGKVEGSFDTKTDKLTYTITYSGLSGPVLAAHFHGPAEAGEEAAVLLPIPGPFESGMHGTLTASKATAKALLAGKTYVNLHTAQYKMGEARAQISIAP